MKIYVLGSNNFMKEMVSTTDELISLGVDAHIHPDYRDLVNGNLSRQNQLHELGHNAQVKRENDYLRKHYKNILESDAILVVNGFKNNIGNYIGGNCLIEMGQAYVNNKKIFLKYNMPIGLSYNDEIEAMDPVCLGGDIGLFKEYAHI